ncbi:MAG: hypothetical protein CL607_09775 [Anaerolineaceae bacterium]|nr:hypothetical protein [Anaerolineaceae bacterium]
MISLAWVSTVRAQYHRSAICHNLMMSEPDCDLILQAASKTISSVTYNLDVSVRFPSKTEFYDQPIHLLADGTLWIDAAIQEEFADRSALIFDTPLRALQRALKAIAAQMNIVAYLPEWVTDGNGSLPGRVQTGVALVDSILYFDFRDFHAIDPDQIPDGWYGVDIRPFMSVALAEIDPFGTEPFYPDIVFTIDLLAARGIDIVRLPDVTVEDRTLAAFQLDVDFEDMPQQEMTVVEARQSVSGQKREVTTYLEGHVPLPSPTPTMPEPTATVEPEAAWPGQSSFTAWIFIDPETADIYTIQIELFLAPNDESTLESEGPLTEYGFYNGVSLVATLEMRDHGSTVAAHNPSDAHIVPLTELIPFVRTLESQEE